MSGLRTGAIVLAGAVVVGLAIYVAGSGPLWPTVPLLAVLVGGVMGGVAAGRWFDVVALGLGGALGVMANGVIWSLEPEAASDTLVHATVPATWAGVLLGTAGAFTFAVASRVPRGAPRLFAGAGMAVLLVGAWLLVNVEDSVATLESYRVVDAETIEVVAAGAPHAWTRITDVTESTSDVRVTAHWTKFMRGSGTADLELVPLTIHLEQPLGGRVVMDGDGEPVRLEQGP